MPRDKDGAGGLPEARTVRQDPAPGRHPLVRPALEGVPETALWALHHRAARARAAPGALPDPMAVSAADRCDYPFARKFGRPNALMSQYLALRARFYDREVLRFLVRHPRATVVSLGEGLETQFWRVDNGQLRWLTVDLPEVVALRRALLPHGDRQRTVACSALDLRWADHIGPHDGPVLVLAQGLFTYLRRSEVETLIRACADRFPSGTLVFDTVPPWTIALSRLRLMRCRGFAFPPMSFWLTTRGLARLTSVHPRVVDARHIPSPAGHGPLGAVLRHGHRLRLAGSAVPADVRVSFADRPGEAPHGTGAAGGRR
ncbi:class I SAM-dependent methyltransferase [Streptomyces sp. ISL-11]|uniref:class I SAM-dependent methyltransferase n=1 Tax=Streptomyces sp. ISL-11 TaxID=2819174 RepID=UPI001BE4F2A1|nr:class I SAM-dependent methyltransferase [Streptomyces sp. ISL-11]MBT2382182.1 class I SAM-dependent methyltransferase [Streptomyces sp. ISL-11]